MPTETLKNIFDAVEPKEYDFQPPGSDIDGQPLPMEKRVGLIADDIKAVLPTEWTNVIYRKPVNDVEYLTLDYSRLVCVLWGVYKQQKQRLDDLELRLSNLEA